MIKDLVFVEVIETSTHDLLSHAITPLHVVRREVVIRTWRNERLFWQGSTVGICGISMLRWNSMTL